MPGGFEVGAGPVAGGVGKLAVKPACFAAIAVMVVIREEAREVAQLGRRAGRQAARPVAAGTQSRAGGNDRRRAFDSSSALVSGL